MEKHLSEEVMMSVKSAGVGTYGNGCYSNCVENEEQLC